MSILNNSGFARVLKLLPPKSPEPYHVTFMWCWEQKSATQISYDENWNTNERCAKQCIGLTMNFTNTTGKLSQFVHLMFHSCSSMNCYKITKLEIHAITLQTQCSCAITCEKHHTKMHILCANVKGLNKA